MYRLQMFKRDILAKRLWRDICKPTRQHHSFLLYCNKNNNNKYLRTHKCSR